MSLLLAAALARTIVPAVAPPGVLHDPCVRFDVPSAAGARKAGARSVTLGDQLMMADIGRNMPDPMMPPFGFSPDGAHMAVQVQRADPDANGYCLRLLVLPTDGSGHEVEVSRGGEFMFDDFRLRDFMSVRAGWIKPYTPLWSPDSRYIAFLRKERGSVQVWLAEPTGAADPRPATALPYDVDRFAWSRDGSGLVVATRPEIRHAAEAIAVEGLRGYLFDQRFAPQIADHPIATGQAEYAYTFISLADGAAREATQAERELIAPEPPQGAPANARATRTSSDGYSAWLEPKYPDQILSPTRLVIVAPDGSRRECASSECEGIRDLWWSSGERTLYAQQVTGWATSLSALMRWDVGEPAPRRVLETEDAIIGCSPLRRELVCAREGSVRPRRLVAIDMETGAERVLFDPNPDLAAIRFGEVERFRFRNAFGVETFADLVLPPDHKVGQRHPLVVVQYGSHGFLRGGTGDEVPVHPIAARGFAVLSFERPSFLPGGMTATRAADMRNGGRGDWADRRQVLSSLEIALDHAVATGTVDPDRIGISGFSDGAGTAQFAMVNSERFRAASMGSCCEDVASFGLAPGPRFAERLRDRGYRFFEPGTEAFWRPMSLILNAKEVDIPLLLQIGDSEYEAALDVVEVWSHLGKGIELYVFPDGPHIKTHPAHRRALYERNVAWFEFWLASRRNCSPSHNAQYERWLAMPGAPDRQALSCAAPYSPVP